MKFGILGDAKIAREKLIPAITKAGHEIVAIGRRNPDKPSDHPLYQGMAQLSYDDMLAMADIDAIYNPLPNHLHASWSRKAMQAGKHVLCEKPMILSEAELDELEQTSHKTGQIIYEAIMVRHRRSLVRRSGQHLWTDSPVRGLLVWIDLLVHPVYV